MKKIIKQEQWVMLPTEDQDNYPLYTHSKGYMIEGKHRVGKPNGTQCHLYLTSDEEIKGGDWCITETNELIQIGENGNQLSIKRIKNNTIIEFDENPQGIEKIIATTDKSLNLTIYSCTECNEEGCDKCHNTGSIRKSNLPQIPESFIKYYVEKQGEVGDFQLIYDEDGYPIFFKFEQQLPKKKMYSKDEVVKLLWEVRKFYNGYATTPYNRVREPFKRWIKENL